MGGVANLGEFDLIADYFTHPVRSAALGVGDDCALLNVSAGMQLAVSSDMLVQGRHFLATVNPQWLGHKALAVNLSDLAACAARPLAFSLALALPEADPHWLQPFSQGLMALAQEYGCELVGGDTTRGPLNICITVMGEVPIGAAVLRSGAKPGHDLYVSGNVGDARLALEVFRGNISVSAQAFASARLRMELPTPRVALGLALRGVASAAIDISDGLLGDLAHILKRSGVGAVVQANVVQGLMALPLDAPGCEQVTAEQRLSFCLAGGDDYELLFTAAPEQRAAVQAAALASATPVTRIGQIEAHTGLRVLDAAGQPMSLNLMGFDHFRS